MGELFCSSQPTATSCLRWSWRLKQCLALTSTVRGLTPCHLPDGYALLMSPRKNKTTDHGCQGDMDVRMRKVQAKLRSSGYVCFSAVNTRGKYISHGLLCWTIKILRCYMLGKKFYPQRFGKKIVPKQFHPYPPSKVKWSTPNGKLSSYQGKKSMVDAFSLYILPGTCFSRVRVTFRAQKAVLCLPCLHSRSKF